MGGGRIDCYLDVASFFSYIAFVDLLANLDKLTANGVTVDFRPVLLGAIMNASGNRPPWMLKAKGRYLGYDTRRSARHLGITNWAMPPNLMELAKTAPALRALLFVKANYPPATFHAAILALFRHLWAPPHANLGDDAALAAALADALPGEDDVRRVMAGRDSMRGLLQAETDRAIELGAFGAPWLWVMDSRGEAEPFFGSDRFDQIYRYLDVPHQELEVLAKL